MDCWVEVQFREELRMDNQQEAVLMKAGFV
jgi:hypothetical protein